MLNSTFKVVYLVLFLVITVVRKMATSKIQKSEFLQRDKSTGDKVLLAFDSLGMIIPLIYVFSPWLDFANYSLPDCTGWLGAILFVMAISILHLSHAHLGQYWSPVVGIKKQHVLITSGIYKYIRHPMYAAHIVWSIAQILLLHNWIAGWSFFAVMIPHYILRVGKEEAMLKKQFGEEYEMYQKNTGRIIPRI